MSGYMTTDQALSIVAHRLEDGSLDPRQLVAALSEAKQNALGRAALDRHVGSPERAAALTAIRRGLDNPLGMRVTPEELVSGIDPARTRDYLIVQAPFQPGEDTWRTIALLLDVLRSPWPYPPFAPPAYPPPLEIREEDPIAIPPGAGDWLQLSAPVPAPVPVSLPAPEEGPPRPGCWTCGAVSMAMHAEGCDDPLVAHGVYVPQGFDRRPRPEWDDPEARAVARVVRERQAESMRPRRRRTTRYADGTRAEHDGDSPSYTPREGTS